MGKSTSPKTSDVIPLRQLRHLHHAVFGNLVISRQSSNDSPTYLYDDVNASLNTATPFKSQRNRIVRSVSFDIETIEKKSREKRERRKRKSAGDVVTKSEPVEDDKLSELFTRNVDDEDVFEEKETEKKEQELGHDEVAFKGETKVFERQNSAPSRLATPDVTIKVKLASSNTGASRVQLSKFEEIGEEFCNEETTTCGLHKKSVQRAFSESALDPTRGRGISSEGITASPVTSPTPSRESLSSREGSEGTVLSLVDDLLYEIYEKEGCASPSCRRYSNSSVAESDYWSNTSYLPNGHKIGDQRRPSHQFMQASRLQTKGLEELRAVHGALVLHVQHAGARLVRNLRRREAMLRSRDKKYDVVTAHLQALSEKRLEDTRIRFSAMPHPGDSGFAQWHDAMKMVARLPGGIPPDFRRRLWLTLAEKHLEKRRVEWRLAERSCFNEWTNPDDEDLGVQIVKDLHRTGCSLFCGAAAEQNQALLKRVLLGFARWNKTVGYCQGFNMLAALILQVVDRSDSDALKVMIYLIEGVLPESYFANNLRGLSVDMAVFRDLLGLRLPALSRHLEQLQHDAGDATTGTSYEPPLTNVFTMQWFLTLFSNCLPQTTVLRVWDLVFLEGNGVLLRTALAIWETLQERIMAVESADEFYSIMGVLTREMLEFGLMDSNNLVKAVVRLPLPELCELRDRHLYDISPWSSRPSMVARRLRIFHADDTDDDTDDDEAKLAVAATYGLFRHQRRRDSTSTSLSSLAYSPDRDRLAGLDINLDISALKEQYSKIRQRQRQAHIILSAACARQPLNVAPAGQVAMNHLLLGKSALISMRGRRGAPPGAVPPPVVRGRGRRDKELRPQPPTKHGHLVTSNSRVTCPQPSSGETLHWKDASSRKPPLGADIAALPPAPSVDAPDASDSSSTSTELCDEPDRLSDFDSEPTSLVIDDDDVGREDAVKECVEVKEEIEETVREVLRDLTQEAEDLGDGELVDLTANAGHSHENSGFSFLDFRDAEIVQEENKSDLKPVHTLAEEIQLTMEEDLVDVLLDSVAAVESLESAQAPQEFDVQLLALSEDICKKVESIDSLLDVQKQSLEVLLPPPPRDILEMFDDVQSELNDAEDLVTATQVTADENFLDFTLDAVTPTALQHLEFDKLVNAGAEDAPEVLSLMAEDPSSREISLPVESEMFPTEDIVDKLTLEVEDSSVSSALSICVMDLSGVPHEPPPSEEREAGELCDSLGPWQDADESFEEFVAGRSTRSDSEDQKDLLKDLVSKLSLDLGGGGDVDVVRRSDLEVVRAKQLEPMTPFYKPKDAKELFTIVDTPDEDAAPPPTRPAAVSPERKSVYRKFVFPVVVPSPEETSASKHDCIDVTGNGDCSRTCEQPRVESSLAEPVRQSSVEEVLDSVPLEVLPVDVLPVGAAFNLGRRKSERALQLISENSEILSQLTRERRSAANSTAAGGRSLAASKKCPSFDLGTEKVTKIAGFKFHSYSVDGGSPSSVSSDDERSAPAPDGSDALKLSPERGSFDPFPVKRRPKQLGLYAPT